MSSLLPCPAPREAIADHFRAQRGRWGKRMRQGPQAPNLPSGPAPEAPAQAE